MVIIIQLSFTVHELRFLGSVHLSTVILTFCDWL
jgi:hypothetical protein